MVATLKDLEHAINGARRVQDDMSALMNKAGHVSIQIGKGVDARLILAELIRQQFSGVDVVVVNHGKGVEVSWLAGEA